MQRNGRCDKKIQGKQRVKIKVVFEMLSFFWAISFLEKLVTTKSLVVVGPSIYGCVSKHFRQARSFLSFGQVHNYRPRFCIRCNILVKMGEYLLGDQFISLKWLLESINDIRTWLSRSGQQCQLVLRALRLEHGSLELGI